ncbi:MAG TPA: enoyl-CoA hydratase/isomerase family protein [Marinospirillum sp.]|uniref:enoyl-CoA hydratase/isomerase family protein n=1 Tax=Marinospirillum sp. TaxID=2183934 RepID=UPI002B46304E|nr:enoyl-CoA hydratase/isomerase family protein [Marinospirillum sp.]HKM15117.1 enoyl-CoA hydratase/isomerase family protein [Marinospirillum sp.]
MSDLPVLFSELPLNNGQKIGVATLNAPRALNALSLEMIDQLLAKFESWASNAQIAAVWLEGTGDKAFCAGGDIVALYRSMTEYTGGTDPAKENPYAENFFTTEYKLDYLIHTYPKPLIVWGNGIVMGGGMGLFAGAAFRVVTETSRLAMPEITIGLYPDVGGSWFLNRMPGRCGLFLGLTGAHFNAADALFVGLADRFITHEQRNKVLAALEEAPWGEDDFRTVSHVLREFETASQAALPAAQVEAHFTEIQQLTDADSDLERAKKIAAYAGEDKWLQRAASSLAAGSPTAMLLIQEQLRRTRHASLREVFQQELNLSVQASLKGEFAEGIRALLIDKDKNPRWHYATVDAVEQQWIDSFFEPLWSESPLQAL